MLKEAQEIIGRLYFNYLMRDLTYVFSGGTVLGFALFAHGIYRNMISHPTLFIPAFLISSYFIGLVMLHGAVLVNIMPMYPKKKNVQTDFVTNETKAIVSLSEIHVSRPPLTILQIERIMYLQHVGATTGTAALVLIPMVFFYWLLGFLNLSWIAVIVLESILVAIFIVCMKMNRQKAHVQDRIISELEKKSKDTHE